MISSYYLVRYYCIDLQLYYYNAPIKSNFNISLREVNNIELKSVI